MQTLGVGYFGEGGGGGQILRRYEKGRSSQWWSLTAPTKGGQGKTLTILISGFLKEWFLKESKCCSVS